MGRVLWAGGGFLLLTGTGGDWTGPRALRMLGKMQRDWCGAWRRAWIVGTAAGACAVATMLPVARAAAQSCTTQARMTAAQRAELGGAAYRLATAVQSGNEAALRSDTVTAFAGDFAQTAYLAQTTAGRIAGDTLEVTQVYLLSGATGQGGTTDFACALAGGVAETDFAIPGLPAGQFAFAMVEARGPNPWLLAFLLEQQGGSWKMAGFYPHPRTAAGHDGVWYWTAARADTAGSKPWLAWVLYGEADQLLRPASFVSSSNLDKLLGEQRTAAPEMLANGLSAAAPLAVEGAHGTVYRVTALGAQATEDGKALDLVMHVAAAPPAAGETATDWAVAAGRALVQAHPELRQGFRNVLVIAESPGANPLVVERPMSELDGVSK